MRNYKIYCAGPLFNPKEREEMSDISEVLEKSGYAVFLPQRDGLELAILLPALVKKGIDPQSASQLLNRAIFDLDVFQVLDCDGLVLNMNGRVPDEGAMVEAGIAWSSGKQIVIYKNDYRSVIQGNCNPLVMGLTSFAFVSKYDDIPPKFKSIFSQDDNRLQTTIKHEDISHSKGKEISEYLTSRKSLLEMADLLINLFREDVCRNSVGKKKRYSQIRTPQ